MRTLFALFGQRLSLLWKRLRRLFRFLRNGALWRDKSVKVSRMPLSERSPLLGPAKGRRRQHSAQSDTADETHGNELGGWSHLNEDDVAIEGMVLVLIQELESRGYTVPHGLVNLPTDMPPEEAEAEAALFRSVLTPTRHRKVWEDYLPYCRKSRAESAEPHNNNGHADPIIVSPNSPAQGTSVSVRPSPLSSQMIDTSIITSPSALLLAGLLSLLISLQAEVKGMIQETDRGVDGELRLYKARRDLGERLYAVIGGLLDSYLLSGDQRDDEGEDALVELLFHDFPLSYDSVDRATCSLDLLLNLSSYPLVEAESLVSHPVVLASTEYVWRNGLMPPPRRGTDTTISWLNAFIGLDRFSMPRILHTQTYLLSTIHAAITVYILMFSAYAHLDAFNPLAPDAPIKHPRIPENHRQPKTWSLFTSLVWWLWIAGTLGWAGEVGRAWHHRGPHPSLPLSPSTLLPLIHHLLVAASLLLRMSVLVLGSSDIILATSLTVLAWSIPFLAASRVLPQNLPAFGAPTHQRWEKIRDGRKRREVGYRPPPKSVPVSHRALRSLEAHLGGLVQFGNYFFIFGILLLWSLSGELDYPGVFFAPLKLYQLWLDFRTSSLNKETSGSPATTTNAGRVSPIEARTTLAFTLILGILLAYFSGGRPSVSGKQQLSKGKGERAELDDLDGWDRYGREVAFRSRRERLAVNRYYSFVPPSGQPISPDSVPSAFCTPPLPSPLNLCIPPLLLVSFIARQSGREDRARYIQEWGRLWIWRAGISPLGLWAVVAKMVRKLRGRE